MYYRATSFSIGSRAIQYSATHNASVLKFQEQISSGLRLQKPSDDPIAFRQVVSLRSRLTELAADTQSVNSTKAILNTSIVQIQEISNIFTRAKTLTQQGIQSFDDTEGQALAVEVAGLLGQLKEISKTIFDGAYIFAGTRSNEIPFEFAEPGTKGGTLTTTYNGSSENSRAYVGEAVSVNTYYSGNEVFSMSDRRETLIFGKTEVESGTGTDTMIGRATLQITHDTTEYLGASGLQVGVKSGDSDTIIGPMGTHSVNIVDTSGDGSAGTISLNGGPEIEFTNASANLEVIGRFGQRIFVDTTQIAAGFNGEVDVRATGNLSVDGGVSKTPLEYTDNQVVNDSNSGRFVNLDTRNVKSVGTNELEFPGTSNAFQLLYELELDLRNSRGLSNEEITSALDRRLGELNALSEHNFETLGQQSTSLAALDRLGYRIQDLELSAESQLSDIQSTNIAEAVLRLENSRALLQYTYSVTAQISSLGLLDFLR